MDMQRVDTQHAYELIWKKITTLELAPGSPINEQRLASDLNVALAPVQEALKLLEHEHLVRITPRHGMYVAEANVSDLEQISVLRVALESLAAALAARCATTDDIAVLEAIRQEQLAADPGESRRLFAIDHKFHQAIAAAAHNKYLSETLDHFFGLSLRFWYLMLPSGEAAPSRVASLAEAVQKHVDLVDVIKAGDAEAAEKIMRTHVEDFYQKVRAVLA